MRLIGNFGSDGSAMSCAAFRKSTSASPTIRSKVGQRAGVHVELPDISIEVAACGTLDTVGGILLVPRQTGLETYA